MSEEWRKVFEREELMRRLTDPRSDVTRVESAIEQARKHSGLDPVAGRFRSDVEAAYAAMNSTGLPQGYLRTPYQQIIEESLKRQDYLATSTGALGVRPSSHVQAILEGTSGVIAAARAAATGYSSYERPIWDEVLGHLPSTQYSKLVETVYGAASPYHAIADRFASVQSPWMESSRPGQSITGFAELQALGDSLKNRSSFDADVSEAVRTGLGDWREPLVIAPDGLIEIVPRTEFYIARGFDVAITNFPSAAFEDALELAGLLDEDDIKTSDAEDDEERQVLSNMRAYERLHRFENALRAFVVQRLKTVAGDKWHKQRINGNVTARWKERQEEDVKAGRDTRPLIEYADFTDYIGIMAQTNNWNEAFSKVFPRLEDVRESLQRLIPARNTTMHNRPISPEDRVIVLYETRRILKALKSAT